MAKIEINEDNYVEYQEFLDAKNCILTIKHPIIFVPMVTVGVFAIIFGFFAGLFGFTKLIYTINEVKLATFTGGMIYLGCFSICVLKILPKALARSFMKHFQKKHPDFDINLDEKEVEKELEKYIQLSKVPEDIEIKKEEHLYSQGESFRKMTTEEKLAFLNQEKAFWEQVAIEEKYKDTGEDTTCQAEIGQAKISTEDKDKVYHI